MKATIRLTALFLTATIAMSCSAPEEQNHSSHVTDSSDFTYRVIYEDIYDTPAKTQVEQHIEIVGKISHDRMEAFLTELYQDISTTTGYQFRDHPDAVYIYVYAPGRAETNWIARLMKHATSSSPGISINFDPGEYMIICVDTLPSPEMSDIEDSTETPEEVLETIEIEDVSVARFDKSGEVITDAQTGLQWRVGPNRDLDWYEARDWVNGLGGRWRMPMQNELKVLFDAGITYDDPGLFENGGWSVWCGDVRDDTYAIDFDLGLGRGIWGPREATGYIRAFAVLSP